MATKKPLIGAEDSAFLAELTEALANHKERLHQTIRELREGMMHPSHAANRLAKMGRELFGEGWE